MVNQETPHQLHNLTSIKDQDIKWINQKNIFFFLGKNNTDVVEYSVAS
jgi:hypothetical protein